MVARGGSHDRLESARLLDQLRDQVDAIAGNSELRAVLRDEHDWLRQAQQLLADVRYFREHERLRSWPAVWRRWVLALVFALASATAAGSGYAWMTQPYAAELAELRNRAGLADVIAARMAAMTPAERRRLDLLMMWEAHPVK